MESFNWVDFNPDYSLKQIEHIDGRGYVPPSCNTLKELGYCDTIENCEMKKNMKEKLKDVGIE
jgi:DNA primase large subunit